MKKFLPLILVLFTFHTFAQSSMRRCTLLPITDSVGGAIGYKVFEGLEEELKSSTWCTYISNSSLMGVFSKYRENLAQYLKQKEVLTTVAEKLKAGSLIRVALINEINGVEVQLEVYGDNGEDIYFSEKILLKTDEIQVITQTVKNWLEVYSKTIPYDAKINGILGDQITLDVGKGYPIREGQSFVVKRPTKKKKHPLLKKIVDWETDVLAEGKVFNISENQALGMVKVYKLDKKLSAGDWVRLEAPKDEFVEKKFEEKELEEPGRLGLITLFLTASTASVDTTTPTDSFKMGGNLLGFDFRTEAWVTREYFGMLNLSRSIGKFKAQSGSPDKSSLNANYGNFKIVGGYKYLPIGFFFGPQIDAYLGYGKYTFDLDYSQNDGFGQSSISGILVGVAGTIPINRIYKFQVRADIIPFPKFEDSDSIYGSASSASALQLEMGLKYQYRPRMTLDAALETMSARAKFNSGYKEISFHENLKFKVGSTINF